MLLLLIVWLAISLVSALVIAYLVAVEGHLSQVRRRLAAAQPDGRHAAVPAGARTLT